MPSHGLEQGQPGHIKPEKYNNNSNIDFIYKAFKNKCLQSALTVENVAEN